MPRHDGKRPNGRWAQRWLAAAVAAAFVLMHALPVQAQTQGPGRGQQGTRQRLSLAVQPSQFIACAQSGQPLLQIPERVSQGGILRATGDDVFIEVRPSPRSHNRT